MKCDELKLYRPKELVMQGRHNEPIYLKSEADKVIAGLQEKLKEQTSIAEEGWKEFRTYHTSYAEAVKELYDKNKEIAELKADYKEACDRLQTANLIKDEQLAATRHQKFKRCLDKANYWLAVSYNCIDGKHRQKAEKHHYKWLKLAEQFKDKEAK